MKFIIFSVLVLFGINVQAQLVTTDTYVPKSPNAVVLDKVDNTPVALATGGVQASFNLYTIKAGKIGIPITLSYHSGGIKVDEIPTSVGLGWSLNAGAGISRTIRGIPDEGIQMNKDPHFFVFNKITQQNKYRTGYYFSTYAEAIKNTDTSIYYIYKTPTNELYLRKVQGIGTCLNVLSETLNTFYSAIQSHNASPGATDNLVANHPGYFSNLRDESSDEYTIRIPGYSGTFSYNNQGVFMLNQNDNDLKIQVEKSVYEDDYTYSPFIKKWTVSFADGLKYYFGDIQNSVAYNDVFMQNRGFLNNSTVTEWNTSEIIDQNSKDTVFFNYDKSPSVVGFQNVLNVNYNSVNYSSQNLDMPLAGSGLPISGYNPVVKSIQSKDEFVGFYYTMTHPFTTLDSIVIKDIHAGQMIKKFIFNYGVFQMSQKLKLISFMEISNDRQKALVTGFDYYDTIFTPQVINNHTIQYSRRAKDYWGYYNHALQNYTPGDLSSSTMNYFDRLASEHLITEDRRPAWPYMQLSVLTAINYPTGGKTMFEYEPHSASTYYALENEDYLMNAGEYNSQVCPFSFNTIGGLRIKKITQLSENKKRSIKSYSYNNGDGSSSGHLNFTPSTIIKVSGGANFGISGFDNYIFSDQNRPSRYGAGSEVNYANVTEYEIDSSGNSNGYIIHKFYNDMNTTDRNFFTNYYSDSYTYPTFPVSSFNMPYWLGGNKKGNNLINGYEQSYAIYDKNGIKLQEHINEYSVLKKPETIINMTTRVFSVPVFYGTISNCPNHTSIGISNSYSPVNNLITNQSYTIDLLYNSLSLAQNQLASIGSKLITNPSQGLLDSYNAMQTTIDLLAISQSMEMNSIANYENQSASSIQVGYIIPPPDPLLYYLDNNIIFPKRAILSKSRDLHYDSFGHCLIKEQNTFYESPYHQNPTKSTMYDSKGDTVTTVYKYAFDFADNVNGDTICSQMKHLYFNPLLSSLQYRKGNMVAGKVALYNNFGNNSAPSIYPASLYTHKQLTGNSNMTIVYPISSYFADNNFELSESYIYNAVGNLLQEKIADDISTNLVWGYKSQYPVAKVIGSDNTTVNGIINNQSLLDNPTDDNTLRNYLSNLKVNLPTAMVSTYTYKPMIGMTSETDPSGNIKYYNYDRFNRLNVASDKDNNILEKTDYHYAQETNAPVIIPTIYHNQAASAVFTKNSCGTGFTGSSVTYTVPANKYSSTISQTDANAQAQNDINTNGQNYANAIGTCTQIITNINLTYTNTTGNSSVVATLTNMVTNQIFTFHLTSSGGTLGTIPSGTYNVSFSNSGVDMSYGVCGYWVSGYTNFTFNNMTLDSNCSELEVDWI
jgi:hypothetical protein